MKQHEAVSKFIDQVRFLYEAEYGDFKRKLGLYIQRLEQADPALASGDGKKVIASMKSMVIYNPSGDIERTRRQVIQLAHELMGSSGGPLH